MTVANDAVGRPERRIGPFDEVSSLWLLTLAAAGFMIPLFWMQFWPIGEGLDVSGHQIGRDFLNTWSGSQLAFAGKAKLVYDLFGYDAAVHKMFGPALEAHPNLNYNYSYPPSTWLLFWPLGKMPYFPALAVWILGTFAALAFVTLSEVAKDQKLLAAALLAIAPGCLINVFTGQNGFLSGALLLGGLMMLDGRPVLAGILFGLLTYKPHLGLVLAFVLLALQRFQTIASATATAGLLLGVSIAMFGVEPWRDYFTIASRVQIMLLEVWEGGFIFMFVTWLSALRSMGVPYEIAMSIQGIVSLAVIAATCWAVLQTKDAAHRALLVAAATPLALPYAFNYDLPALSACLVWVIAGRISMPASARFAIVLAWLAPVLSMNTGLNPLGAAPIAITIIFALAVFTAARERRGRRDAQADPSRWNGLAMNAR